MEFGEILERDAVDFQNDDDNDEIDTDDPVEDYMQCRTNWLHAVQDKLVLLEFVLEIKVGIPLERGRK